MWKLLSVLNDWQTTVDKGHIIHAAFLDLEKAFDRVDHDILLKKLASIGLSNLSDKWFRCYPSGRSINNINRKDIRSICKKERKEERQTGREVRKKIREFRNGVHPTNPSAQNKRIPDTGMNDLPPS